MEFIINNINKVFFVSVRLKVKIIKIVVIDGIIFFFFNIIINNINSIIIKIVLVKNNTHIKKFFAIISARKLFKIFDKIFGKFHLIFSTIDSVMMKIIFTDKRAFLVTDNSSKKIIGWRRSFGRITILFNMIYIINSVTGILASFFTDIENNSLHIFFYRTIVFLVFCGSDRIRLLYRNRIRRRSRSVCIRRRSFFRRIIAGSNNLTSMCIIIIVEEGLKEIATFFILTFDDNIGIISVVIEHTNSIIRFVRANRSMLFGKSETEMGFVRTLDDIFEEIVFGIVMTFDILKNEVAINVIIQKHKFLVGTVGRQGL